MTTHKRLNKESEPPVIHSERTLLTKNFENHRMDEESISGVIK